MCERGCCSTLCFLRSCCAVCLLPDVLVERAATVLRLLFLHDLRASQNLANELMMLAQECQCEALVRAARPPRVLDGWISSCSFCGLVAVCVAVLMQIRAIQRRTPSWAKSECERARSFRLVFHR